MLKNAVKFELKNFGLKKVRDKKYKFSARKKSKTPLCQRGSTLSSVAKLTSKDLPIR